MIKEKDQHLHNMLLTRILITDDPKRPIERKWVKCFRLKDYLKYFVNCSEEDKIGYRQSMDVDEAELVHDPTLVDKFLGNKEVNEPIPGPATAKLTVKQKLQSQAKQLGIKGYENMSVTKLRNAINEVK